MTRDTQITATIEAQIGNMTEEELYTSVFLTLKEQYDNAPEWYLAAEYKTFVETSR